MTIWEEVPQLRPGESSGASIPTAAQKEMREIF